MSQPLLKTIIDPVTRTVGALRTPESEYLPIFHGIIPLKDPDAKSDWIRTNLNKLFTKTFTPRNMGLRRSEALPMPNAFRTDPDP